jgi:hypothetical protein
MRGEGDLSADGEGGDVKRLSLMASKGSEKTGGGGFITEVAQVGREEKD